MATNDEEIIKKYNLLFSDDIYCVLVVADGFKHYCENCVEKAKAEAIYEVD